MTLAERLRALWLRWERLALAGVVLLPTAVATILGFVWLWERGWFLQFAAASVIGVGAVRLIHWWVTRHRTEPARVFDGVPPSSDWTDSERATYQRAQARIRAGLAAPIPWESLPPRALEVVEGVAEDLSGGRRGALDFTAPEALLLIGRLAARYRRLLVEQVPFADRMSVQALWWVWQQKDRAGAAARGGWMVWRGVRLVLNPASALLREVEGRLASALQDRLGGAVTRDLQARLLDEAAQAAIDLYSGRLRFTDAELAAIATPDVARDAAQPDEPPVRIVLVGQLSAGKSTLVNALADADAAETDAAPTTDKAQAVPAWVAGHPVRLIDTPGLDGRPRRRDRALAEMLEADIVLWVLRADRPDRGPDLDLRTAFDAALAAAPDRRPPPVVSVAAAADVLLPGWPYPEHTLPPAARHRLGAALAAMAGDLPGPTPVPIVAQSPAWNLDALEAALAAALPEARQVARQRRRLAGQKLDAMSVVTQAGRGLRSVAQTAASALADRFRSGRG